ncbi:MAG: M15 family peptidase [Nitriliruptorales bacterium]|nr:M15 family peptidase [Nitriliruptorales bacterium]
MHTAARGLWAFSVCFVLVACSSGDAATPTATTPAPTPTAAADAAAPLTAGTEESGEPDGGQQRRVRQRRPGWLGTRVLPRRPDGFGEVRATPPRLRDRRLPTIDVLPAPSTARFGWSIAPVPDDVLARSTWSRHCPVRRVELRYATVTFHGFEGRPHTGELLVHRAVARDVVRVFHQLYRLRFPIEEMRVVRTDELDLPPTGDGNNTTAFVCRPSRGSTSWSEHAYGRAVDVNPFHNPYSKGGLVLPELASAYLDRDRDRPGMITPDGPVVGAFERIGWRWGGDWRSVSDWMHFSVSGR